MTCLIPSLAVVAVHQTPCSWMDEGMQRAYVCQQIALSKMSKSRPTQGSCGDAISSAPGACVLIEFESYMVVHVHWLSHFYMQR